jgi:hypothetical protein
VSGVREEKEDRRDVGCFFWGFSIFFGCLKSSVMKKEDGGVPALSTQDRFGLVNWESLSTKRRRERERGRKSLFFQIRIFGEPPTRSWLPSRLGSRSLGNGELFTRPYQRGTLLP